MEIKENKKFKEMVDKISKMWYDINVVGKDNHYSSISLFHFKVRTDLARYVPFLFVINVYAVKSKGLSVCKNFDRVGMSGIREERISKIALAKK